MKRYILSTLARQDLKAIKDYIARDSLDRAEHFVKRIAERFQTLAQFPDMGRRYDVLAKNLRGFPVGNYIIFYRPINKGISVERILSGYRDLESLFPADTEDCR
jgi:toxin ParE1/3/4